MPLVCASMISSLHCTIPIHNKGDDIDGGASAKTFTNPFVMHGFFSHLFLRFVSTWHKNQRQPPQKG